MSLKIWVEQLRALHDKFKAGKLTDTDDRAAYEAGREQLARAMLASQHLTLKPGETPRRALRVVRALQVDLALPGGNLRTPTVDISSGGFGALIASSAIPTESLRYKLRLPGGDAMEGRVM